MEENKFFKFVWRFNGIILMIAGVLAIGLLGFAWYDSTRVKGYDIVNVAKDTRINEKWNLGQLEIIGDTPYLMVPLYSDQSYTQSGYGKTTQSIRNILFINSKTDQKHWFFDTNDYLIARHELLPERDDRKNDKHVSAILYLVIKKDTNGDKRLTTDDKADVIISAPDGGNQKEILNGIDRLIGHRALDPDMLFIIFQKQEKGYSANVSLRDFSISHIGELPIITKNP